MGRSHPAHHHRIGVLAAGAKMKRIFLAVAPNGDLELWRWLEVTHAYGARKTGIPELWEPKRNGWGPPVDPRSREFIDEWYEACE